MFIDQSYIIPGTDRYCSFILVISSMYNQEQVRHKEFSYY